MRYHARMLDLDIVLVHPEIPPNCGNVIRLCANTGARLHLVKPLGFELDDRRMKRAGLDYHEYANLRVHEDWAACSAYFAGRRLYTLTTKGTQKHVDVQFRAGDVLVFGSETKGLPAAIMDSFAAEYRLRLPMRPEQRSLNLSNAVAIAVFEVWRQMDFAGGL